MLNVQIERETGSRGDAEERRRAAQESIAFNRMSIDVNRNLIEKDQKLISFNQKLIGINRKLIERDQKLICFNRKLIGVNRTSIDRM